MNKLRYFLHPGYVKARDGDRHYIGAAQLAALYGLSIHECIVIRNKQQLRGRERLETDVHLFPRADGKYSNAKS